MYSVPHNENCQEIEEERMQVTVFLILKNTIKFCGKKQNNCSSQVLTKVHTFRRIFCDKDKWNAALQHSCHEADQIEWHLDFDG